MPQHRTILSDLLDAGLIKAGDRLTSRMLKYPGEAFIMEDGLINYLGETYSTPSGAGKACKLSSYHGENRRESAGWHFWYVMRDGDLVLLDVLRRQYEQGITSSRTDTLAVTTDLQDTLLAVLLSTGAVAPSEMLCNSTQTILGEVMPDGTFTVEGHNFSLLKEAAKFVEFGDANSDTYINCWKYWHVKRGNKLLPLSRLRDS